MKVKMLLDKGNPESLLIRASFKNGPFPLIFIDNVESNKRIDEIDENEIKGMAMILPDNAPKLYGEKGKNGVITILTRKKASRPVENKPADTADHKQTMKSAVIVRGLTSSAFQVKPLIIIDGVGSERGMEMVPPDEISSISVLKNASATSLYGDKGVGGVIIVTTKKKASVSVENKSDSTNVPVQQKTVKEL